MYRRILLGTVAMSLISTHVIAQEDPYLWLEDVMGDKAIAWVKEQNAKSQKVLEASRNLRRYATRFWKS